MAASKSKAPAASVSNERTGKRNATAQANASLDIDFAVGKSANELASEQAVTRSVWISKLSALRAGVEAGKGQRDTFYRIGTFATPSGARTVIRELGRRPERLPGAFDLEPRVTGQGAERVSELWASVPSDEEAVAEAA